MDFENGSIWSAAWQRRLSAVLWGLRREAIREVSQLHCQLGLAQLARLHRLDDTTRMDVVRGLQSKIFEVTDSFLPWLGLDAEKFEQKVKEQLQQTWEMSYGRLDDPETQQKIIQTVEALARQTTEPGASTPGRHLQGLARQMQRTARSLQDLDRQLSAKKSGH